MIETIAILNSKIWYRFLKVIYFIIFFITLVVSLFWLVEVLQEKVPTKKSLFESSLINCDGNYLDIKTWDGLNHKSSCEASKMKLIQYDYKYSAFETVIYILLDVLAVCVVFEFLRRIFYYVLFGTIKPQKSNK